MQPSPQRTTAPSQSTKRDARIRIERIPEDLHAQLSRFASTRRYSKMTDALFYAASVGLKVLQAADGVTVIKGDECLHAGR